MQLLSEGLKITFSHGMGISDKSKKATFKFNEK